jgi:hypothetical protein
MFLFNSLHPRKRKVFALAVLFCLSVALLFTGCDQNPDPENTGFIPVGEWTSEWDGYVITKTTVEYGELKGTIEKAIDFSNDAGVLIIKITASSGDFTVGKYTGVYYSEYTSTSIKLANVWLEDSDGDWYPLEADSLSAAVSLFSVDNVDDHVSYWGVYTKE